MAVGAYEGAGTDQVMGEGIVIARAARHRGGLGGEREEAGVVAIDRKAGTIEEAEFQRRGWVGCEGRPQGGKAMLTGTGPLVLHQANGHF
jgi:hypothetical protein